MEYDHGDSFPFDFESKGNTFGSKLKGKLLPRSYPIQFERKWNTSFLSVLSTPKDFSGSYDLSRKERNYLHTSLKTEKCFRNLIQSNQN